MDPGTIHTLSKPSPAATAAYEHHAEVLTDAVNRTLAGHREAPRLLGGNPLEVMYANHRHHHLFLTSVYRLGTFQLLWETIPWVYRSYHAHGFSYDYFPVELRAWLVAMAEHLDPEHLDELRPVYDWMLDAHETTILRAASGADADLPAAETWRDTCHQLVHRLLEGDRSGTLALAEDVLAGTDLQTLYLQVLQPALFEVGLQWERGEISVAQEHLATALVGRVMDRLGPPLLLPATLRGRAVVTAAPNEHHEVGARMVADLLELDGWGVHYLGSNTPAEDLVSLLLENPPELLMVSVCVPFNVDKARRLFARVRAEPKLAATRIMTGGQAFRFAPDLWQELGADGYAADAAAAASLAARWAGA